jgi:hypothetical protein
MHKLQRRYLFIALTLFLLMIFAGIGIRYFPINKILRIVTSGELHYTNQKDSGYAVPNTLLFNFEADPASANPDKFFKGIAHSGQYSAKAFGTNSYTLAVERKAGEIGTGNLSAIGMSAWIYVFPGKNEPLGNLVFAASNNKINIAWKGVRIAGSEVPRGKWFKISGFFDLSDVKFNPETKLEFYFWNNSNTEILTDDLYIVFGSPKSRRGDSARVDLTGGHPFSPAFNFPPFPFSYFLKDDIHNENSSFIIKKGAFSLGDISPYDRLYSGHFLSGPFGTEDLLVIPESGEAELFTFCTGKNEFRKVTLDIPPDLMTRLHSDEVLKGSFTADGDDQLLFSGNQGLMLVAFEKIKNKCPGNETKTSFKVLFNTLKNPFSSRKGHLIAADLDGNKQSEILDVSADGSWKIFRLEVTMKDPFRVIASGPLDLHSQWNSGGMDFKIYAGHFLGKYNQDILLTVGKEKTKYGFSFSLLRFDPVRNTMIPCFPEQQNYTGKTIGLDTLRPEDEFFTGIFDNTGKPKVFRYNHDWRYDLKEIQFNDTTFRVIANMDFSGYENDYNPKYFEILRLFPGILFKPGITSFLVIGKNCKQRDQAGNNCIQFEDLMALPNSIQVYSLGKTVK